MAPSQLLVASDADFAPFAKRVNDDIDATLAAYDVTDAATLSDFASTKASLQMLAHDFKGARVSIARWRELQSKPAAKLLTGRYYLRFIEATTTAKLTHTAFAPAYDAADRRAVEALPWATVADPVKAAYVRDRLTSPAVLIGNVANQLDPQYAKSKTIDGPGASVLIATRAGLRFAAPFGDRDAAVLHAYIVKNDIEKPDVFAPREVTIAPGQVANTVNVGIWDSGVDSKDYPDLMYRDAAGNDGLKYDDAPAPSASDLYELPPNVAKDYDHLVRIASGRTDIESGVESPAASETSAFMKSLTPETAKNYFRSLDFLDEYEHGSHVAGIATRGNAAAKIVNARFDDNFANLVLDKDPSTWVASMAAGIEAQGAYFRANHVRVVNMSWGDQENEFEGWLTLVDPSGDPQARKTEAQRLYDVWRTAVSNVITQSPDILFVTAAGNSDSDASFGGDVPASFTYPNILVVGAVNQAGDPASFTSYGPTVAIFANGYNVPSRVPGNHVLKFSGTSMASPNVANLAAKLFALHPTLTPVQVRKLILDGAMKSADGKRLLVDPKKSVELSSSS